MNDNTWTEEMIEKRAKTLTINIRLEKLKAKVAREIDGIQLLVNWIWDDTLSSRSNKKKEENND